MQQIVAASRFIRDQVFELSHWTDEALVGWISHGMLQRRFISIYDADKRIVAVGSARCQTEGQLVEDWYFNDEDGDMIYVDLVAVTKPDAMKILWEAMKVRFKPRNKIAFRRLRDERFRIYDFATFDKHLTHGTKTTSSPRNS
jgi:hypothetical protein